MRLNQKKNFPDTINDKIFEANSSFYVKKATTGKVAFLFFRSILLLLAKLSIGPGDWALGYHSINFRQFPDFS